MQYTSNCPAVPEYFDPRQPISHSRPVHHTGFIRDLPAACVWAQLEWERERGDGGPEYLTNLELRWHELDLCANCLREADHPLMIEIDSLRHSAADAERKLDGINQALRLHDQAFKMAVLEILDRDEADQQA